MAPREGARSARRVARDIALEWSPLRRLTRTQYWLSLLGLLVVQSTVGKLLSVLGVVIVLALCAKCAAWRYRDAGHAWWWAPAQLAVLVPSVVFAGYIGLAETGSAISGSRISPVLVAVADVVFLGVAPASVIWWLWWSLQRTKPSGPSLDEDVTASTSAA